MSKSKGIISFKKRLSLAIRSTMEDLIKTIEYRKHQEDLVKQLETTDKHIGVSWARRGGKDYSVFKYCADECRDNPNTRVAYYFPTIGDGKDAIFEGTTLDGKSWLKQLINIDDIVLARINGNMYHHDNSIRFKNGSKIRMFGGDRARVGTNENIVVFSEAAHMPKFKKLLDNMLPSVNLIGGKIIAISTPNYGSYFNKMMLEENDEWYKSVVKADKMYESDGITRVYTDKELDKYRKSMSLEEFQQNYMCDMEMSNEASIYSQSIRLAKYENKVDYIGKKILISFDLGFNDGQSLVFSVLDRIVAKPIHWYYTNNKPTGHYVDYINEWLKVRDIKKNMVELILPHDGNNRQDGYSTLVSRATMYRQQGFKVSVVPAIKQQQGIDICRASIQHGDVVFENSHTVIQMVNGLKGYEYKVVNGISTGKPVHGTGLSSSNIADSLEYLCIYLFKSKYMAKVHKNAPKPRQTGTKFIY